MYIYFLASKTKNAITKPCEISVIRKVDGHLVKLIQLGIKKLSFGQVLSFLEGNYVSKIK